MADPPVHATLSGVSLTARLRARGDHQQAESTGGFLFTHRGYSGPSVLDVSHVAVRSVARGGPRGGARAVGALRAEDWERVLEAAPGLLTTALGRHLPQRLVASLMTGRRFQPIGG